MIPKRITIHYSATRPEWMQGRPLSEKIAEITRWHKERKFRTIGYHYIIDRDGTMGTGRPPSEQGAHVKGHNKDNLGICMLGGHGGHADGQFDDWFTPEQKATVIALIKDLQGRYGIPDSAVKGHNNYNATSCPGCDIPTWWAGVNRPTQSIPNRKPSGGLGAIIMKIIKAIFGRKT